MTQAAWGGFPGTTSVGTFTGGSPNAAYNGIGSNFYNGVQKSDAMGNQYWTNGDVWELLDSVNTTNLASYQRLNLGAYAGIKIEGQLLAGTAAAYLQIRVSEDNATFISAASYFRAIVYGGSVAAAGTTSASETSFVVGNGDGSTDTNLGAMLFNVQLDDFNKVSYTKMLSLARQYGNTANTYVNMCGSALNRSAISNGIQLTMSSGIMAQARFRVYGVKG